MKKKLSDADVDALICIRYGRLVDSESHTSFVTYQKLS